MTNYKTAKVLGKDKEGDKQFSFVGSFNTISGIVYTPELMGRAAIAPNIFDMGLKLFPIGVELDGKLQYLQLESTAMGIDFSASYSSLGAIQFITLKPTFLFTFDLSKKISLTGAPSVMHTIIRGDATDIANFTVSGTAYGGYLTMDIKVDNGDQNIGVMPEISYFHSSGVGLFSAGIGFRFITE